MKLAVLLVVTGTLLFGGLPVVRSDNANVPLTENEAYVLLDQLLALSAVSNDRAVELQRYKQWASLHARLMGEDQFSKEQMKIYLFAVFVAEQRVKVDSLEEMAKVIVPKFKKQPELMLAVLNEMPFLLPATCNRIGTHFDLFGSGQDKQQFLTSYGKMITEKLGKENAKICLVQIRES